MPRYYPMMMDLSGRNCLVVGGGEVAVRKVEMLVKCGASVTVVAPKISGSLKPLIGGSVRHLDEKYSKKHMESAALVIGATNDETVNRAVHKDASDQGTPVNIVDVPELCSFIVPSVVEQGDLLIAISTSGKSPATAKRIRKELQKRYGAEYGTLLNLLGEVRLLLAKMEPDTKKRGEIFSRLANSDLLDRIRAGEGLTPDGVIKEISKER